MSTLKNLRNITTACKGFLKKSIPTSGIIAIRKNFIHLYASKPFQNTILQNAIRPFINFCDLALKYGVGNAFVELELSNICNAKCVFCPYVDMLQSQKKFQSMSMETYDKILEQIKLTDFSLIDFTPTTGDILVNPRWDELIYKATKLSNIKRIMFYTNGILMHEKNQEKAVNLLKKDENKKIYSLLFSVGGLDRETYKFMFGVDRFDKVVKNLNQLQEKLIKENIIVAINIEFRLPKNYAFDIKTAKRIFNQHNYPFNKIHVLNKFVSTAYLKKYDELEYHSDINSKEKACSYLKKTRFAADGSVWADGCVISELPNGDASLKLGTVNDSWKSIEKRRSEIINDWEEKDIIPEPCKTCTFYRVGALDVNYDKVIS